MSANESFSIVFRHLKTILQPHAKSLTITVDEADAFSLDGPFSEKWQKPLFFGSVQIKKNYVSFYLMPVYMYPDLLKGISPELKKHMQGKSCFNFKRVEPELFKELAALTRHGAERFKNEA